MIHKKSVTGRSPGSLGIVLFAGALLYLEGCAKSDLSSFDFLKNPLNQTRSGQKDDSPGLQSAVRRLQSGDLIRKMNGLEPLSKNSLEQAFGVAVAEGSTQASEAPSASASVPVAPAAEPLVKAEKADGAKDVPPAPGNAVPAAPPVEGGLEVDVNRKMAEFLSRGRAALGGAVEEAVADPCPELPLLFEEAGSSDEQMREALLGFAKCSSRLMRNYLIYTQAIDIFRLFQINASDKALAQPITLSSQTPDEMIAFLQSFEKELNAKTSMSADFAKYLRTQFSDADLDELSTLAQKRREDLRLVERKVFAAMDARPALFSKFGTGPNRIDRYAALLSLKKNARDLGGFRTFYDLKKLFAETKSIFRIPSDLTSGPGMIGLPMIHPYAIGALLPDPGKELERLDLEHENPFVRLAEGLEMLGGPIPLVDNPKDLYRKKRDMPVPPLPAHAPASDDAVHVAVLDSGVDWLAFPDLGMFLGDGTHGQLASVNLGGGVNQSPHSIAAAGKLGHGTGVMASLVTIVSRVAPEILEKRQLDLAMWKDAQDDWLLSYPYPGNSQPFSPFYATVYDLLNKVEKKDEVKPKIVSVSMTFNLWSAAKQFDRKDSFKKAPWLWVMAAGNEGRNLDLKGRSSTASCLEDFPDEYRDDSSILCVGALKEGVLAPKVAAYSNRGARVNVYAYESYFGACPNGTSCSTPAVTAAVAVLAQKYPSLTPAQLKQVIVEAAVERDLKVGYEPGMQPKESVASTMKVRVFDPLTMMGKALELGAKLSLPQK